MSNKINELLTVVFKILDGIGPTVATVCGVTLYVAMGRRMQQLFWKKKEKHKR